jgi:hypothetical protein
MITNDARRIREIKSRIVMAKAAFNKKKALFASRLDINVRKKLLKCYTWSTAFYGVETCALGKVYQKYLESFKIWCWRRMEKISWTDRVRNEELLYRVKEERNILRTIKIRKAKWIVHILRRNCLLKHVIHGKIEVKIEGTGKRGRRRKKLLDDFKHKRGYWKLIEEALDSTLWRTRFRRRYGPVVRLASE